MIRAFTNEYLLSKPRPAGYLDEIRRCAKTWDAHGVQVETDSPCWIRLHEKYANYKPTPSDYARALRHKGKQATQAATTILSFKRVPPSVARAREAVCSSCDQVEREGGTLSCGVCGCGVGGAKITELTLYQEDLPHVGCKHPMGSRWKKAGL